MNPVDWIPFSMQLRLVRAATVLEAKRVAKERRDRAYDVPGHASPAEMDRVFLPETRSTLEEVASRLLMITYPP